MYRTPAHREGRGVVEIPGGVVYGFKGYIGPDVGGVLTDASSLWSPEERQVLTGSAAALAFGVEDLDGTTMSVWAGNAWPTAHGLLQGVPGLDLLHGRGFGLEADRYLLEEKSARVIFEALDILGIPVERRHFVPRDQRRVPVRDVPRRYRAAVHRRVAHRVPPRALPARSADHCSLSPHLRPTRRGHVARWSTRTT